MLIDFICLFIVKSYFDFQRCCICCITFFTLINRIFYFIFTQSKIYEIQA